MSDWMQKQATLKLLQGRRVKIVHTTKKSYQNLIGLEGVVDRVSGATLGVRLDNANNTRSKYGVCWLSERDVEILDVNETKEVSSIVIHYDYVATIKLCDDPSKEYKVALFKEDKLKIDTYEEDNCLVITNIGGDKKRTVGTISEIESIGEYKGDIPRAEVVAVANMSDYNQRCIKAQKAALIAHKQLMIELAVREQLDNNENNVEYYHMISKLYPDNEKIQSLVLDINELYTLEDTI